MCVHTYVCTIRGRVTEEETSSKKNALHSLFFFLPSKKQSTSPSASEREGRSIHFFIFCEQSTQFPGIFFPSLSFQARISCAMSSSLWEATAPLQDEGKETWICPPAKDICSGLSLMMFKKGLNCNYMTLMPSASPYPRCLNAHSDGIHCLPGSFYCVSWADLPGWDLFFCFYWTIPTSSQSKSHVGVRSWRPAHFVPVKLLLLNMPEDFQQQQLCLHES